MNLTAGQTTALQHIRDLKKSHPEGGGVGIVGGWAGTGKTTLLKVLADEYGKGVLVVTPTGKAAVRVREAAGARASTIHRWLYEVKQDEETGKLEWGLKELGKVERPSSGFLLVDEASMVGFEVFRDLYRYCGALGLNLVLVGDGFQLPPVETNPELKDFTVFDPNVPADFKVNLTEILRQALDSPIIRASQQIREGRWPEEALGALPAVPGSQLYPEANRVFEAGGATICHRNATRHQLNAGIRAVRGLMPEQLKVGEPLMVVQNNYDLEIYNGEITDVRQQPTPVNVHPVGVRDRFRSASCTVNYLKTEIQSPILGPSEAVVADREVFGTLGEVGAHMVRREAIFQRYVRPPHWAPVDGEDGRPPYLHANLGYALTAHKSQGSEFGEVMVVLEDSLRLNSPDGRRWAYVAVTRAKKSIKICWMR